MAGSSTSGKYISIWIIGRLGAISSPFSHDQIRISGSSLLRVHFYSLTSSSTSSIHPSIVFFKASGEKSTLIILSHSFTSSGLTVYIGGASTICSFSVKLIRLQSESIIFMNLKKGSGFHRLVSKIFVCFYFNVLTMLNSASNIYGQSTNSFYHKFYFIAGCSYSLSIIIPMGFFSFVYAIGASYSVLQPHWPPIFYL